MEGVKEGERKGARERQRRRGVEKEREGGRERKRGRGVEKD